jgi:hypothetical protein
VFTPSGQCHRILFVTGTGGLEESFADSITAQIGTLSLNAFGLLDFGTLETPSQVLRKEGVCPL